MSIDSKGLAVVTGASTGIGAVYADRLAKRGYDLLLVARNAERLSAVAERLHAETGRSVKTFVADLADAAQVRKVAELIEADEDFALLVNNAGIALAGTLATAEVEEVERIIAVNISAPTVLARAATRALQKRGSGAIISIASVLALAPDRFESVYSATKSYMLNLGMGLAQDLQETDVRVQVVLPGATRTEIWERSGRDVNAFPPDWVMEVDHLVDAAFVGFDAGETVTIPPLAEEDDWNSMQAARQAMIPKLSRREVAPRYRVVA
ncbi:SDR family oxidoreductase [Sphingobium indicum]|uniref:SDR family oxidoreductase n=1 Tax=Sphingobium indicum TaxID=332055 RepID=A0A4Q4J5I3_9SPHN|nr:SDR family oxidoreductase [Sphingobium indicum]NYI23653.1 hypothetical protein [Sphingobium indicum]RYM01504.1 SDR family oxidoreductase [Sphingobium indicum]